MAIDRRALVARHNPILKAIDPYAPLSVGNGELAFTADITGLQTFPEAYADGIPLCTMSQWGWHSTPADAGRFGYAPEDIRLKPYATYGRQVGYPTEAAGQEEAYHWLRKNPHRLHLGRIGLSLRLEDGREAGIAEVEAPEQTLDLWRAMLSSSFRLRGKSVRTQTCCHPQRDILAFSVASELLKTKQILIEMAFPYGSPEISAADWDMPERHETVGISSSAQAVSLLRRLDRDRYYVELLCSTGARITQTGRHCFQIEAAPGSSELSLVCGFSPYAPTEALPSFAETASACEQHWQAFWLGGGAVELAESAAAGADELERRIVLSQYLTAIQCAGSLPPQETGLTCNSWHGKFHLEMHWWHAAHFPLWGRPQLLERSMWWYQCILPQALDLAASQGYAGARWPKQVAYDGIGSPSPIAPLLIWQQPHPIYLAELLYRAHPDPGTLARCEEIVFATAEFMASYAVYDRQGDRYVLGPPLIPAQENHAPEIAINPAYELEYWAFGLNTANAWRRRLGLAAEPRWAEIAAKLSPLPEKDGVYLAHEACPETFTKFNVDHPSMLAALGVLPGVKADRRVMMRTLERVFAQWRLEEAWGWDFPMMAMTAARLGRPELAVKALLLDTPKNTYLPNGHNRQGQKKDLPLYLPGNGGLLTAAAMMAAGWEGGPAADAPGFPKDGKWKVRHEGLSRMP